MMGICMKGWYRGRLSTVDASRCHIFVSPMHFQSSNVQSFWAQDIILLHCHASWSLTSVLSNLLGSYEILRLMLWLSTWRPAHCGHDVFVWNLYKNSISTVGHDWTLPQLFLSMSIIEDSPLSIETSATPVHGTNTQANVTHHFGAAACEGITLTRHYVTRYWGSRNHCKDSLLIASRTIQDVIKPAIKTFLETCDTNPRIAVWVVVVPIYTVTQYSKAVVATPALLGFLVVLAFL